MKIARWTLLCIIVLLLSCSPVTHKPKERIVVIWESSRDAPLATVAQESTLPPLPTECKPKLPLLLVLPSPPYLSSQCENDEACVQEVLFTHIEALTAAIKKYQNDYRAALAECQ